MASSAGSERSALERFIAGFESPASPRRAYALAAAIGLVVNLLVFGAGHALGTSAYWDMPQWDSREYLIGYRYFLAEPWHWPPFEMRSMNVPLTKSIAFTDSIPLFAFVNKALATVVPPWAGFSARAYLGLWHLLVYALQAVAGVACVRALGRRSYGAAVVTSLFFLALPTFVWRYEHASLAAHFLTITALALYLRTPSRAPAPPRLLAAFVALLVVATLVNPYHVAMSFALFVVALLRTRAARTILVGLPVGALAVGLSAALAGFFAREAKVVLGGFDSASTNLLSAFVPYRSVLLGDGRRFVNVTATEYQYEGYDYLGLGLLVLLLLFLPRVRELGGAVRRHPFLFALALGTFLFALSNHVYLGPRRVLTYDWPAKLHWIVEQYRSPGRFVWLPTYALVVFLLGTSLARFREGRAALVVPALALLQVVDGGLGDYLFVRGNTRGPYDRRLDLAAWRPLVEAHDAVEIHPPYDCILDGSVPEIDKVSQEIQYLASWRARPINGVYSCRPTRDCVAEGRSWVDLRPRGRTLYVLLPQIVKLAPRFEVEGASCGAFPWGRVCSNVAPAIAAARAAGALGPPVPPPTVAVGQKIFLGSPESEPFVERGWSYAEGDWRWSVEHTARVVFHLAPPADGAMPAELSLHVEMAVAICGARKAADVDVILDGKVLSTEHFDEAVNDARKARVIPIPAPRTLLEPITILELRPRDIRSPKEVGCNQEERNLGLVARNVWFE